MGEPPSYGSMPPQPWDPPDPAGPAPPVNVRRAAACMYALAALQVLAFLAGLVTTDRARTTIRESSPELTESEVTTALVFGLVVTAVFAAVFAGLYLLCARKLLGGRNWARITGTVLSALLLIFGVLAVTSGVALGGTDAITFGLTVVQLVLAVGFLYAAWTRPANAFFAAAASRFGS